MLNEAKALSRADVADQPRDWYAWYVVGILLLAYTVSYVDRTILTLLVAPIRASLQISDMQISLLHGLAFAIFYTFLGIPIARLADRYNRARIMAAGIFVWSSMSALCGFARNFGQLFLARIGVGVGEAALSPAAYSMLSDYFPGNRLTRALSVYTAAAYVGAGLALIVGGAAIAAVPALDLSGVGHLEPWQVVFLCVGLPGMLVAALLLTVREPTRQGLSPRMENRSIPLRQIAQYMGQRRSTYGLLIGGYAAHSLLWNGAMAWIPTFFIRTFGWSPAQVGLRFGLTLLVLGTAGIGFGGFASGWIRNRGRPDANLLLGVVSSLLILPAGVLAPLVGNEGWALGISGVFVFAGSMPYGAAAAAFQEITPNQMRAQVSALYLFGLNLAGIGAGPTVVALFTDHLFRSDAAVRYSIALTTVLAAPLATFLLWRGCRPYRRCIRTRDF